MATGAIIVARFPRGPVASHYECFTKRQQGSVIRRNSTQDTRSPIINVHPRATPKTKTIEETPMTRPIAIAALLLAASAALPAAAATHPSAPVELAQYRQITPQQPSQRRPVAHRDDYNAHAAAPSTPDAARAGQTQTDMPAGWHCMQRRGDDPSAFPNWEFCP
jgi:hypothetical protein